MYNFIQAQLRYCIFFSISFWTTCLAFLCLNVWKRDVTEKKKVRTAVSKLIALLTTVHPRKMYSYFLWVKEFPLLLGNLYFPLKDFALNIFHIFYKTRKISPTFFNSVHFFWLCSRCCHVKSTVKASPYTPELTSQATFSSLRLVLAQ